MNYIHEAFDSFKRQRGNFTTLNCGCQIWADPYENEYARAFRIRQHYERYHKSKRARRSLLE